MSDFSLRPYDKLVASHKVTRGLCQTLWQGVGPVYANFNMFFVSSHFWHWWFITNNLDKIPKSLSPKELKWMFLMGKWARGHVEQDYNNEKSDYLQRKSNSIFPSFSNIVLNCKSNHLAEVPNIPSNFLQILKSNNYRKLLICISFSITKNIGEATFFLCVFQILKWLYFLKVNSK